MKFAAKLIFLLLSMVFVMLSCSKRKEFSNVPFITLKSFQTSNDSAIMILKFTDGDGDLGQSDRDTVPPYDLFIRYFEKKNGVFSELILPSPFNYRIPQLNPSGRKKALQGEIILDVTPTYYNPFTKNDTLKLEIFLWDNAGNESNHVSTNEVVKRVSREWQ